MFRNNQNKQKTTRNSRKFVKISSFLIPHTISSVCFGCFDTNPKHRTNPKKIFWSFAKKQTKKQPKQIEFRFDQRKKNNGFEDPLIENVFWRFFRFVSTKFCLFRLFRYRSETPKQTEKQPKQIEFRFVSVLTEKKFDCFEDTCIFESVSYCKREIGIWCCIYRYMRFRIIIQICLKAFITLDSSWFYLFAIQGVKFLRIRSTV